MDPSIPGVYSSSTTSSRRMDVKTHITKPFVITLLLGLALILTTPLTPAAHEDHGGGDKGGAGEQGGKGGHGGGAEGGGHGMGMHKMSMPGSVMQMCKEKGHMPPHYCEPAYKVMSSAKGIQISDVSPAGDQALMVTLTELNAMNPGVNQDLVVVGGTGDLAGAVIVKGGWKQNATVHLEFVGTGSIYNAEKMPVHVFPLTGM